MAGSTQSEEDEKIALEKMQIKMAHALFVRRLAFLETNGGDGYCAVVDYASYLVVSTGRTIGTVPVPVLYPVLIDRRTHSLVRGVKLKINRHRANFKRGTRNRILDSLLSPFPHTSKHRRLLTLD
jgi:hypothetical protein